MHIIAPGTTKLELRYAKFSNQDASKLAEELKSNTTVTTMYLFADTSEQAVTIKIAKALETNTSIRILDLRLGCQIYDDDIIALAKALIINAAITSIDLRFQFISDLCLSVIFLDVIKINYRITTLNYPACMTLDSVIQPRVQEQLAKNKEIAEDVEKKGPIFNYYQTLQQNNKIKNHPKHIKSLVLSYMLEPNTRQYLNECKANRDAYEKRHYK